MLHLFYIFINYGYRLIFGRSYMLHAPLFQTEDDSLFQAQMRLTDYCISALPPLNGKRVLDIGCGNGTMTRHIFRTYSPSFIYGIDVVPHQISIANKSIGHAGSDSIKFRVDNAQQLDTVEDGSFDIVVCLESALHYPDKKKFLFQVSRVLKPGGYFLIADLLDKENDKRAPTGRKRLLFNWSHMQYLAGFRESHLELTADTSLSQPLLSGFKKARAAVAKDIKARKPFASPVLIAIVRPVLWLYHFQLRRLFEYRMFIGRCVKK